MWEYESFPSGTGIVADRDAGKDKPWYDIIGPGGEDEIEADENKRAMGQQLKNYLNGGVRPKWLDDFERTASDAAVAVDGSRIEVVGPMIDINPPHCFWQSDMSETAIEARTKLMDDLFQTTPEASR